MRHPDTQPTRPRRGRTVALVVAAAVVLAAASVGVYGLVLNPSRPQATSTATLPSPGQTVSPTEPTSNATPTGSRDSAQFARLVASTLFDWDTTVDTPTSIRDRLLVWADPTGQETPGLISDLTAYLPDTDTWATLLSYGTVQRLDITSVQVPSSWPGIVVSASPGQLQPDTTAWTVTGTRHREGVAFGQPATSDTPVAFTMFIACPPSVGCYLLRLSQPGNPLQ